MLSSLARSMTPATMQLLHASMPREYHVCISPVTMQIVHGAGISVAVGITAQQLCAVATVQVIPVIPTTTVQVVKIRDVDV
jgi:hypothetical protein